MSVVHGVVTWLVKRGELRPGSPRTRPISASEKQPRGRSHFFPTVEIGARARSRDRVASNRTCRLPRYRVVTQKKLELSSSLSSTILWTWCRRVRPVTTLRRTREQEGQSGAFAIDRLFVIGRALPQKPWSGDSSCDRTYSPSLSVSLRAVHRPSHARGDQQGSVGAPADSQRVPLPAVPVSRMSLRLGRTPGDCRRLQWTDGH